MRKTICSLSANICDRRPPSHYVGRAPPRDCSCISEWPRAASTAAAVMESARIVLKNMIFQTWEILLFHVTNIMTWYYKSDKSNMENISLRLQQQLQVLHKWFWWLEHQKYFYKCHNIMILVNISKTARRFILLCNLHEYFRPQGRIKH